MLFIFTNINSFDCQICLEEIEENRFIELPCRCKFHEICLIKQFSMPDKRLEPETVLVANQDYDDEYNLDSPSQALQLKRPLINCKDCAVCGMYIGNTFNLYLEFYKAYKNKLFYTCLELAKKLSQIKFSESGRQSLVDQLNKLLSTSSIPETLRIEFY
ncbi:MAG: hypothetical protein P4L22_04470 [Candidatus Babeliales bacterium]|nr:hypothetical protein [Candidatus Babeliales bacterium]